MLAPEETSMISSIIAIASIVAVIGSVLVFLKRQRDATPSGFKKRRPLSSSEQTLFHRLTRMLPEHTVLPQMPLTRCMVIKGPALQLLRNERIDFVICNRAMQIVAAIDLVSAEELGKHREKLETLKEEAFETTGIQLLKWPANPVPSEAYIAMELEQCSWFQTRLAA
jgi:hypothetical protein